MLKRYLAVPLTIIMLMTNALWASADMHHKRSYKKDSSVHYATVVDAAVDSRKLSTLVAALKAGDLVSALQSDGPFVVFAPTNKAFDDLPDGTLESLLKPESKSQLQNILKYHVVSGSVLDLNTLQGSSLGVAPSIEYVGNAHVIKTVMTGNGVIYVIDQVLLPQ